MLPSFHHPPVFTLSLLLNAPSLTFIHPPSSQLLHFTACIKPSDTVCSEIAQWAETVSGICVWKDGEKLISSLVHQQNSIFNQSLSCMCYLSAHRPQNTTSLRVWSAVGVRRWCWVKVGWFMRRASCRFSRAPVDLFHASTSQTTRTSVSSSGTRYSTHVSAAS